MALSDQQKLWLIVGVALVIFFFVFFKKCKPSSEGYVRSQLGQDCVLHRTNVDFMYRQASNPHYKNNPTSKFKALSEGPVDFYQSERGLDNGTLFSSFRNDYTGCKTLAGEGTCVDDLTYDTKTHRDLMTYGWLKADREAY